MKVGKWWVQSQILSSGNDPAEDLDGANWPEDYAPSLFMSGDAHRTPPFQWTTRGVWPKFFDSLVVADKLCCHVELYADAVKRDSVPDELGPVFTNGKVFGWESDIWKDIERVLDLCIKLISDLDGLFTIPKKTINDMVTDMMSIGNRGYLQHEGQTSQAYSKMMKIMDDPVPAIELFGLKKFLQDYQREGIRLRSSASYHGEVARRIQQNIDRFSDHFHLITAGGAHLINNPLYGYILPPTGTFGVADPYHM